MRYLDVRGKSEDISLNQVQASTGAFFASFEEELHTQAYSEQRGAVLCFFNYPSSKRSKVTCCSSEIAYAWQDDRAC